MQRAGRKVKKMLKNIRRSVTSSVGDYNNSQDFHVTDEEFENTELEVPRRASARSAATPRKKITKQAALQAKGAWDKIKPHMPVILVTDIGADIDDTLALLILLGSSDLLNLVAIVTSVNDGVARAALARGWLRNLGVGDKEVEILPSVDACEAKCHIPETFPSVEDCGDTIGEVEDTPQRILEICKQYRSTGVILVGIASLTPIADALRLDTTGVMREAIRRVYLQGNAFVNSEIHGIEKGKVLTQDPSPAAYGDKTASLTPNPLAYNFRNDLESAQYVFDQLQYYIPFTMLGKFAAYKIGITKYDFNYLSEQSGFSGKYSNSGIVRPSLTEMAKRQMNNFRRGNPELFNRIYHIDEKYHDDLESTSWFDEMPLSGVCSHPYDPLLLMCLVEDAKKEQLSEGSKSGGLEHVALTPKEFFDRTYMFVENHRDQSNTSVQLMHTIIGNSELNHGVPVDSNLHDELITHIAKGLRRVNRK